MILASFDLSFFTSIPGMLITGGVLLLLIALIIFIATGNKKGKKDKKENTDNTNTTVVSTPTVDMNVATEPVPTTVEPNTSVAIEPVVPTNEVTTVETAPQTVITAPEIQSEPISVVENSTPIVSELNNQNSNQTIETNAIPNEVVSPQAEMPTQPVEPITTIVNENIGIDTNPAVMSSDVNNVEQEATTNDILEPSKQDNNEVAAAPIITVVNEEPKETTAIETQKQIYGGIDPVIPKIEVETEEHRPIYGGANPLENTGTIPTINNNIAEKTASIVTPEVPSVEPAIEHQKTETANNSNVFVTPIQEEKEQESKKEVEIESLF